MTQSGTPHWRTANRSEPSGNPSVNPVFYFLFTSPARIECSHPLQSDVL